MTLRMTRVLENMTHLQVPDRLDINIIRDAYKAGSKQTNVADS